MSFSIHNETLIYNVNWVKLYPVDVCHAVNSDHEMMMEDHRVDLMIISARNMHVTRPSIH